jgi:tRNA(Ile2)-agmatinylcytidine synthase
MDKMKRRVAHNRWRGSISGRMNALSALYHVGFDDTDSSDGMCTTFLVFNLVRMLRKTYPKEVKFVDYPNLIRLNPNIPWKTRGNAALVLRIRTQLSEAELFDLCRRTLELFARSERANAGLVLFRSESIPEEVRNFSKRALYSVLSLKEARLMIDKFGMRSFGLRSQQGLVGALAGIGNPLLVDHTYELLAYRKDPSVPRMVDRAKIIEISRMMQPLTFNSYDEESGRILITPHGPDPVLLGIRGETPSAVKRSFEMLLPLQNLLGWMIFRSNQGTGEHLENELDVSSFKAYWSGKITGIVSSKPKVSIGGHVFFTVSCKGREIPCACYEPTGRFRLEAMKLEPGDIVEVGGGVRKGTRLHSKVLNLEYFRLISAVQKEMILNPKCENCETRMRSEGKGKGFSCPICGRRSWQKEKIKIPRSLGRGIYLPAMKAHRHLTKPLQRYGLQSETQRTLLCPKLEGDPLIEEIREGWFGIVESPEDQRDFETIERKAVAPML